MREVASKQVQIPGLGLFWYKNFGEVQNLFLWVGDGGCYQALCGKYHPQFCSVLSPPGWRYGAVVREFFYSQKRLNY